LFRLFDRPCRQIEDHVGGEQEAGEQRLAVERFALFVDANLRVVFAAELADFARLGQRINILR
jgi:hypothetical protein